MPFPAISVAAPAIRASLTRPCGSPAVTRAGRHERARSAKTAYRYAKRHRALRLEDPVLLKGQGHYLDDIALPDTLHCAFVRSPHAHARIDSIDVEDARAMEGVHAVLTLPDLMSALNSGRMPLGASPIREENNSTPFVLSNKEVAYVGEPIALVVAASRYIAEDAVARIMIEMSPLPVVADARAGMAEGAPAVRTGAEKQCHGAVTAISMRPLPRRRISSRTSSISTGAAATRSKGAACLPSRGRAANYTCGCLRRCRTTYYMLQTMLGLDQDAVRVITPHVGGGFGPKYCPDIFLELAVPAAALLLKRTLKWVEDRRETFISSIQERDQYWSIEVAVDTDARLLGLRGQLVHDQGAYAPKPVNLPELRDRDERALYVACLQHGRASCSYQQGPDYSVRGAGYPQAVFAMERTMDLIAANLGLDRAEVRRRNPSAGRDC